VLVLIDRREPVPPSFEDGANVSVLKKPFDAFELRLKVEHLLRSAAPGTASAPRGEDEEAIWLEFPYVPAPAGAVLRRAAKLRRSAVDHGRRRAAGGGASRSRFATARSRRCASSRCSQTSASRP
jgi:hypothetical protein